MFMALKKMDNLKCLGCGHYAHFKEFMPRDIQRHKARCPKCRSFDLQDFYNLPVNNEANYPKPKRKYQK